MGCVFTNVCGAGTEKPGLKSCDENKTKKCDVKYDISESTQTDDLLDKSMTEAIKPELV